MDKNFFPIETPYNSDDYKIMKDAVNQGIDSHLEAFTKSEFKKSPNFNNKFLWNIHVSELPILYRRLEKLYDETGNEDYMSIADDIRNVADTSETAIAQDGMDPEDLDETMEITEEELREMIQGQLETIDPYDPMDDNQTIDGEPAGNSDLARHSMMNRGIENYIDDDTTTQELASENSSDSLTNAHGENLKPQTIDEVTDMERYEDVVFMQGDEAELPLELLYNDGPEAALEYLKQWHNPGEGQGSNKLGHSSNNDKFEKDGYIMSWNKHIPYFLLQYDTEYGLNEDSQMKRHLAGQRGKDVPLGQHAPHSQVAIKNYKKKR